MDIMPGKVPSEQEVLSYFDTLSNWGRWGEDAQLGTLNFLTPEKTKQAVYLVNEGVTVSCARTVEWGSTPDSPSPPIHYMVESGEGWGSGDKLMTRTAQTSIDFFGMIFHGYITIHIYSLAHFFWKGKMYNNQPPTL